MPRAGLNGKYRIWADDDILQMIFVQYIGIKLCNVLKPALKKFMTSVCARDLEGHAPLSQRDQDRRRYYLNEYYHTDNNLEEERRKAYMETFFLSQLPNTETSLFDGDHNYDGDDTTSDSSSSDASIRPTFKNIQSSVNNIKPQTALKKSGIKQKLLRQLTTELIIHRLRGKTYDTRDEPGNGVALVQTDLQWQVIELLPTRLEAPADITQVRNRAFPQHHLRRPQVCWLRR